MVVTDMTFAMPGEVYKIMKKYNDIKRYAVERQATWVQAKKHGLMK